MRKHYLFIITLLNVITLFGQIPNPSFENWSVTQPNGWTAMFTQPYSPYQFETKNNNAYLGLSSLKSEVLLMPASTVQIASGVYTGTPSTNYYVPIGPKPTKLFGWYIFQNNLDILTFNVSVKSGGNVIGTGVFTSTNTVTAYTQFSINITYTSAAIPDSFSIGLSINYAGPQFTKPGHLGTYFIVDNLSFDINVGLDENYKNDHLKVYPNPANTFLTFQNLEEANRISEIEVFDTKGELQKKYLVNEKTFRLDIHDYNSGLFFYKLIFNDGKTVMQKFVKL